MTSRSPEALPTLAQATSRTAASPSSIRRSIKPKCISRPMPGKIKREEDVQRPRRFCILPLPSEHRFRNRWPSRPCLASHVAHAAAGRYGRVQGPAIADGRSVQALDEYMAGSSGSTNSQTYGSSHESHSDRIGSCRKGNDCPCRPAQLDWRHGRRRERDEDMLGELGPRHAAL